MNKKIIFLSLLLAVLILPLSVAAYSDTESPTEMAERVKDAALTVGASIVIIGWVIAGILYLTAAGGDRMGAAKKALIGAVIGTVLIVIADISYDIIAKLLGY